jgi:hypothetical protein
MLHDYGSIFGNTFHTIRLEGNSPQNVKGQIRTWVFQLGQGWKRSSLEYRGFPFVSGFGANASAAMLVQSIRTLAEAKPGQTRFFEGELLAAAPEIKYLTPSQHADLNQELSLHTLKVSALDDGHIELWRIYEP